MLVFQNKCSFFLIGISNLFLVAFVFSQSPVPPDAELERIATGFQFVEGPVWSDELGLLFSDIPANTVYRWQPDSGASVYLRPSGNSNGLAFDSPNRLLLAQHGNRRLARLDAIGAEVSLASHYDGKRLNSPNDIAVKLDGAIFFTDPQTTNCNWGDADRKTLYITSGNSVYRIRIGHGSTTRVSDHEPSTSAPRSVVLHAVHPNPFNPQATIDYELLKPEMVEISVHDALGRHIETLIQQRQEAGSHSLRWHAGDRSAGVYFFRMKVGEFIKVQKCVLLK